MLQTVTLDDSTQTAIALHTDTVTSKRLLMTALGLVGIGSLRDSKRVRPSAHGAINETTWEDGRTITLAGEVISQVSIEDCLSEFRLITRPMMQTLDVGPALLKWQEGTTGNALQMLVKLDSDCEPTLQEGMAHLAYQVHFFAEDPRAYTQAQTQVVSSTLSTSTGGLIFPQVFNWLFNPASGGVASVTQAGNRPTPPIFRIHGTASNPWITRASTGLKIALLGTVSAPDYLEIDTAKRTVKLNGTSDALSFLDPAHTSWDMSIPPNPTTETYTLGANGFDSNAYLDVFYRSAYA